MNRIASSLLMLLPALGFLTACQFSGRQSSETAPPSGLPVAPQATLQGASAHSTDAGTRYLTGLGLPQAGAPSNSAAIEKLESYLDPIDSIPVPDPTRAPSR